MATATTTTADGSVKTRARWLLSGSGNWQREAVSFRFAGNTFCRLALVWKESERETEREIKLKKLKKKRIPFRLVRPITVHLLCL